MLAELARISVGNYPFAGFQAITALLLLAAAASSLQAGPGLLMTLARVKSQEGEEYGILPSWLGRTNRYYTPLLGGGFVLGPERRACGGCAGKRAEHRTFLRRCGVYELPGRAGLYDQVFVWGGEASLDAP